MKISAEKVWLCWVGRSGYAAGSDCHEHMDPPPHDESWGCGWHWDAEPRPCRAPEKAKERIG